MSKPNSYRCDACYGREEPQWGFPENWIRLRYEESGTWIHGDFCCLNCAKAWLQTHVEYQQKYPQEGLTSRRFIGLRMNELIDADKRIS